MQKITANMYQHPADKEAIDSLKKIPMADTIVRTIHEKGLDAYFKIMHTGSYFKITQNSYPKLYDILLESCERLSIHSIPKFYLKRGDLNAYATNVQDPIVTITSDAVEYLTEQEIKFIIGHELGHIQCQHVMYSEIAMNLHLIMQFGGDVAKLISYPVRLAIMRWYRKSELTCDRAGLLSCRDINVAISAIAKLSGFYPKETKDIDIDSFLEQIKDFDSSVLGTTNKFLETLLIMESSHPWAILRAKELCTWYKNGYYDRIINYNVNPENQIKTIQYCKNCGESLLDSTKYCKNCGHEVN